MWTFFSWKSQNIFYAKLSQNSSEVIACDCLLKGIEPLCVINFCRFVIIDLIQDTRHLCTRFRMDGKKAKTRIFQISSELEIFFSVCLPPEKPRRVTFKRVQRWRVSWIRSIAGAVNDLGKRTKLNFPYTLGSFLKSVLVVSFILENAVCDKFFHDTFSKTTIELIRFNLYKCVFAFNERESLLF